MIVSFLQRLALAIILFIPAFGLFRVTLPRSTTVRGITGFLLFFLIFVSLFFSSIWRRAADLLGVNSGLDLVLYLSLLLSLQLFSYLFRKQRQLDDRIAHLVQQLALAKAFSQTNETEDPIH